MRGRTEVICFFLCQVSHIVCESASTFSYSIVRMPRIVSAIHPVASQQRLQQLSQQCRCHLKGQPKEESKKEPPLITIIAKHGLQGHLYAVDSQVYGFCRPNSTDVQHLRSVSTSCISDIADWMQCNRLELNSSKSEFIWCSSSRRLKYLDYNPFVIGADAVQPKNEVRDLGLVLDRDLTMTSHITGLVRTSFAILRQLRSVSRSLTQDATRHLVQSLILSRIDYCNVAFAGLPQRSIIRLQA